MRLKKIIPEWIISGTSIRLLILFFLVVLFFTGLFAGFSKRFVENFGLFAVGINEQSIKEQTCHFLMRIIHEQSQRYETVFQRLSSSSALLASQAAYFQDQMKSLQQGPSPQLVRDPASGMYSNMDGSPVMVQYWGAADISAEVAAELKSLYFLDSLLVQVKDANPECVAAYVVTSSGIRRKYPNSHDAGELQMPSNYDIRQSSVYLMAGPAYNPHRKTIWSSMYQADFGGEMMITAATPIYSAQGEFAGIAGIDITLKNIVTEILNGHHRGEGKEKISSFLLDATGVIIAMSPEQRSRLGLQDIQGSMNLPGIEIVRKLFDSPQAPVRKMAERIIDSALQTVETLELDHERFFIASHRMPSTGWHVCTLVTETSMLGSVSQTRGMLESTIESMKRRFGMLGGMLLLVSCIMAMVLVGYFVGPLKHFMKASRRIQAGDLTARIAVSRKDELGQLAGVFNEMVAGLEHAAYKERQHTALLEQEVLKQTREVVLKNEALEKTLHDLNNEIAVRRETEGVLKAREQELMAVNQQLMAGEQTQHRLNQQLRAGNQQLVASEQELRESKEFLEKVFETAVDGIVVADSSGYILRVNSAMEKMLGFAAREITGRYSGDMIKQEAHSLFTREDIMGRLMRHGKIENWQTELCCKDGDYCPVEIHVSLLGSDDRTRHVSVASVRDIRERKKAEEERVRLSSVIEHTAATVTIMSPGGEIQYINPALGKLMGYTLDEVRGINPFKGRITVDGNNFYDRIWQTITRGHVWAGVMTTLKKDGTTCEMETVISPIRDLSGMFVGFAATGRDVTSELVLKKQLQQAQKLEAIGTLAGGIAHDFNNILMAIMGYTDLALLQAAGNDTLNGYLNNVLTAGNRAINLVKQILTFSRQSEQSYCLLNVLPLVKETLTFIRASLPATIEINTRILAKDTVVMADPTQMQQILMNLCTNAKHAMAEKGGAMEIVLANEVIAETGSPASGDLALGKYLKMTVIDTGCGMDAAVVERIFDPFFTTKAPGEGTGLGLSVVHGIVKSCKGGITVFSQPGKGTTFHVYLPVVEGTEETDPSKADHLFSGCEQVLFVDDEAMIVPMMKGLLEQRGYRVTARTSSVEALALFRSHPGRFDVVITDQTMPNMTGVELVREMLKIRSDIPIILCTGYSETINEVKASSLGIRAFITKPVVVTKLAQAIRTVLDTQEFVSLA